MAKQLNLDFKDTTISIQRLDLSVRANNVLTRAGIATVGDLIEYTATEIRALKHCGTRTLEELIDVLNGMGLEFNGWNAKSNNRPTISYEKNKPVIIQTVEPNVVRNLMRKLEISEGNRKLDRIRLDDAWKRIKALERRIKSQDTTISYMKKRKKEIAPSVQNYINELKEKYPEAQ